MNRREGCLLIASVILSLFVVVVVVGAAAKPAQKCTVTMKAIEPTNSYEGTSSAVVTFEGKTANDDCRAQTDEGGGFSAAPTDATAVCRLSRGDDRASVYDSGLQYYARQFCGRLQSDGWQQE